MYELTTGACAMRPTEPTSDRPRRTRRATVASVAGVVATVPPCCVAPNLTVQPAAAAARGLQRRRVLNVVAHPTTTCSSRARTCGRTSTLGAACARSSFTPATPASPTGTGRNARSGCMAAYASMAGVDRRRRPAPRRCRTDPAHRDPDRRPADQPGLHGPAGRKRRGQRLLGERLREPQRLYTATWTRCTPSRTPRTPPRTRRASSGRRCRGSCRTSHRRTSTPSTTRASTATVTHSDHHTVAYLTDQVQQQSVHGTHGFTGYMGYRSPTVRRT